ncbi:MAG: hypothetical protein Q7K45_03015 [Nanoarchaeota archaeon]|nr:hypothetical protein [Nanoarchaeota archaeon]
MDHLAILDKKRKLLAKIISGEKTIESRWYKSKVTPWDRIKKGEMVYFKESGEPVSVRAKVLEVMQFYLPRTDIPQLLHKYGKDICFEEKDVLKLVTWCSERKYCILIRLKEVQQIEPFNIDKTGFGNMAAWMTVENINSIKK